MINNYQVLLYNGLSLYGAMPLLLYALWDTWAAFMNFINALLLDKVGRIPIMVFGQVCYASIRLPTLTGIGRLFNLCRRLHGLPSKIWRHRQPAGQWIWSVLPLPL